jgi:hypothetical protein
MKVRERDTPPMYQGWIHHQGNRDGHTMHKGNKDGYTTNVTGTDTPTR